MRGAIAAVCAEAKTSHESFPLGSKFGFSAAILKKDKYIALHNTMANGLADTASLATTSSFIHLSRPDTYDDTILAVHPEVSRRKKEAQRAELITQYETFEGYEEAFKEKIVLASDEAYLATIINKLFGFSDKTVAQMLDHLEQQCLALTAREKKTKMKDVNLPWDRDHDIETYFVKAGKLEEDLQENYSIEWKNSMKITQAEDKMYRSNMFSKEELTAWEEKTMANKTWVHLQTYFKDRWTATM